MVVRCRELPELPELGVALQLDSLLNLDGGGSSQFRLADGPGLGAKLSSSKMLSACLATSSCCLTRR